MHFKRWQKLPPGFLQRKYAGFCRLGWGVQQLVYQLAEDQKFRCALCPKDRELIIEHDHDPEEGPGNQPTIYNIRGLVCDGCNTQLSLYEQEQSGNFSGLENVFCRLDSLVYENYTTLYKRRVRPLNYDLQAKRIGCSNYEHRRSILEKFDAWYHYEEERPPRWYRRYKEKKSLEIETPEDVIRVMTAFVQSVDKQFKKNPNYELPEKYIKLLCQIRLFIDDLESTLPDNASASPVAR